MKRIIFFRLYNKFYRKKIWYTKIMNKSLVTRARQSFRRIYPSRNSRVRAPIFVFFSLFAYSIHDNSRSRIFPAKKFCHTNHQYQSRKHRKLLRISVLLARNPPVRWEMVTCKQVITGIFKWVIELFPFYFFKYKNQVSEPATRKRTPATKHSSRRPATNCRLRLDGTSTRRPKTSEDDRRRLRVGDV